MLEPLQFLGEAFLSWSVYYVGGHVDNSVKLISMNGAKTIESAAGHCAPVTCLALSPDCSYLVTGSRDTTVILWRIHCSPSQLNNISETPSSKPSTPTSPLMGNSSFSSTLDASRKRRIEGPMHVLRGHLKEVVCCCVSSDLGLIASCSNTSGVLLHSLRRGRLVRKLDVENVHAICLSPKGVVLIWNALEKKICTFTVNGIPIAARTLSPFFGSVNCIEISIAGENALLGTCSNRDDVSTEYKATESSNHSSEAVGSSLSNEDGENRTVVPVPSILFLNLHTLEVHIFFLVK